MTFDKAWEKKRHHHGLCVLCKGTEAWGISRHMASIWEMGHWSFGALIPKPMHFFSHLYCLEGTVNVCYEFGINCDLSPCSRASGGVRGACQAHDFSKPVLAQHSSTFSIPHWCFTVSPSLPHKLSWWQAVSNLIFPQSSGAGLLHVAVRPWGSPVAYQAQVGLWERRSLQAEIHSKFPQLGFSISPQIMLPKVEMPFPFGKSVFLMWASRGFHMITKRHCTIKKAAKHVFQRLIIKLGLCLPSEEEDRIGCMLQGGVREVQWWVRKNTT